ncbi:MAG: 2-phosphosulfolactate phosphatase [Pirellulaceae bacterium]
MTISLRVHLLPALTSPEELTDRVVVVIDVLRATTTITTALAHGALQVIPCLEVDEAREAAARQEGEVLLGGERDGVKIAGFDLGNSPEEYTRSRVAGKTIVFTTTNGTRAMMACRGARRVLLGALVNFSAVCHELSRAAAESREVGIDLLCAGTRGEVTREDVLLAGALVDELSRQFPLQLDVNDQADLAGDVWRTAVQSMQGGEPLAEVLRRSCGGRNMLELGQERDIEIAARIDSLELTPVLDLAAWTIRPDAP